MRRVCLFLLCLGLLATRVPHVYAATSCTASVTPGQVSGNSEIAFSFSITNTGDSEIYYLVITRPSTNFDLLNYGVSGWSVLGNNNSAELYDNTIEVSGTEEFEYSARTADTTADSADWTVQALGDSFETCTGGPFGVAIGEPLDTAPPVMSEPVVSNAGQDTITIGWSTDEAATSEVRYGLTYGVPTETISVTDLVTAHSVTITGLSANTTYYYEYRSVDAEGNAHNWADFYTFTTLAPNTTPTPTSSSSSTSTPTATPVPTLAGTSAAAPDTTGPSISLANSTARPFSSTPTITGRATDASTITSISYSLNGAAYVPATTGGAPSAKSANFSIALSGIEAGSHKLSIRATDSAGNGSTITRSFTVDLEAPKIQLITDIGIGYAEAPLVEGTVTDNTGVASVEYSLDGGVNYLPAEFTLKTSRTEGTFTFQPAVVVEGNYPLVIRATDTAGNVSEHRPGEIIIDRLPPKIGLVTLSAGPLMLRPSADSYTVVGSQNYTVILSAGGGPNHIELRFDGNTYDMTYLTHHDIWKVVIPVGVVAGERTITAYAVDGAGNEETKDIMLLEVAEPGYITTSDAQVTTATVTLYHQSATGIQYVPWPATAYGQTNPQAIESDMPVSYILPTGNYYIEVTAAGYRTVRSEQFILDKTTIIAPTVVLEPVRVLRLGKFAIPLPYLSARSFTIDIAEDESVSEVVGQSFAQDLSLPVFGAEALTPDRLAGTNTILSIISDWSPDTALQLSQLEALAVESDTESIVIIPEISPVEAAVLKKRGQYRSHIVADQESQLLDSLGLTSIPTHLLIGRDGHQITGVMQGFTSLKELQALSVQTRN